MSVLVPLPIILPLIGAAASLLFHGRLVAQRIVSVVAVSAAAVASVAMLAAVDRHGRIAVDVGGWPAPVGITLVADLFAALMVVVAMLVVLAVLVYAMGSPGAPDEQSFFHTVYLVLTAGVAGSFLTGDLFNLFVFFEVMLVSSYVLLTLGGTGPQLRSGMTYVVVSLVGSLLFITTVALLYAATGTVNMADLAGRLQEIPEPVRDGLGLLLLVVFGIKAAIFPLFFWLPDSYPTAPTPVTAIFAGLLTKVGVYAIIRTQTLLFPTAGGAPSELILAIAGATMLVGVLGAVAQDDVKRILSFHIVSQIGYMIFGLGLFSVAGIAGAIFFLAHQIVVKTALFLVGGIVEAMIGTAALHRAGGMQHRAPVLATLFLLGALSLAGLPPFSGFVAKLALIEAGLALDRFVVVAVSLVVSLLTLFSMLKIWCGVFWGEPHATPPRPIGDPSTSARPSPLMLSATAGVVALSLVLALVAGPLFDLSRRAAADVVERGSYVSAVLER